MSFAPLIRHLQSDPVVRPLVEELQQAIGTEGTYGPCVYFASSYEKLERISETREILPRNAVQGNSANTEFSATGVQARRKNVFLGDGYQIFEPKKTHDCLNFFFNPYNSTLFAFARNLLIRGGLPLKLGILEIPLDQIDVILRNRGGKWACSDKNIAKGAYTSGLFSKVTKNWHWDTILDCSEEHQIKPQRAAEFLLWMKGGSGLCSSGLPIKTVSRILIPKNSPLDAFNNCSHVVFLKSPDQYKLLKHDDLLNKFDNSQNNKFKLFPKFTGFLQSVSELPIKLELNCFANRDLATSNIHGIPHVNRVMLWTYYLSQPSLLEKMGEQSDKNLAQDALLAAAIHDLRRETDKEDTKHGEKAAKYYSKKIADHCSHDTNRINRIMSAVTCHCKDDTCCEDPNDPVFKILKDADALDRGRFAGPCDGSDFRGRGCNNKYCLEHKGCVHKTLRLRYEKIETDDPNWPFRKKMAMAAWNVAHATQTAPWDFDEPEALLVEWLQCGRKRLSA